MKRDVQADHGHLGDVPPLPTNSMSLHAVSVSVRPSLGLACMNNMKNRGLLFQDSYLLSCSHLTSSSFHFPDTGDTLSPSSVLHLNALSPSISLPACSCFPRHFSAFPPLVHPIPMQRIRIVASPPSLHGLRTALHNRCCLPRSPARIARRQ